MLKLKLNIINSYPSHGLTFTNHVLFGFYVLYTVSGLDLKSGGNSQNVLIVVPQDFTFLRSKPNGLLSIQVVICHYT